MALPILSFRSKAAPGSSQYYKEMAAANKALAEGGEIVRNKSNESQSDEQIRQRAKQQADQFAAAAVRKEAEEIETARVQRKNEVDDQEFKMQPGREAALNAARDAARGRARDAAEAPVAEVDVLLDGDEDESGAVAPTGGGSRKRRQQFSQGSATGVNI